MNEVLNFIGTLINVGVFIYSCSIISKNKLNYKNIWLWICLLFLSVFITFALENLNQFIRIIFSYLFLVIFNIKIFKLNIQQSSILAFLVYCLMIFSEMMCVIFLSVIIKINIDILSNLYFGTFIMNVFIGVVQNFILSFGIIEGRLSRTYYNLNYNQ